MTYSPKNSLGPFLPTSVFFPDQFEEFRVKFLEFYRNIANVTDLREVGVFDLLEFLTGEQWFNPATTQIKRRTFRTVFSIGPVASGATSNTAHGLTGITAYTRIFGTGITDVIDYRPIPYTSATLITDQTQIKVDATNITIINGATAPNFTSILVILEYLKN